MVEYTRLFDPNFIQTQYNIRSCLRNLVQGLVLAEMTRDEDGAVLSEGDGDGTVSPDSDEDHPGDEIPDFPPEDILAVRLCCPRVPTSDLIQEFCESWQWVCDRLVSSGCQDGLLLDRCRHWNQRLDRAR